MRLPQTKTLPVAVMLFPFLSASDSCNRAHHITQKAVPWKQGTLDATSLIQQNQIVKLGDERSGNAPGETKAMEASEAAERIAHAKMLYKRRLAEREMAFNRYEAGKEWAERRIMKGKADLEFVENKERELANAAEQRENAVRAIWKAAAAEMRELEDGVIGQGSKIGIQRAKIAVEKHAEEVLRKQLIKEGQDAILQSVTKGIELGKAAEQMIKADDFAMDKASFEQAELDMKSIETKVSAETTAEENVIMEKVQSDRASNRRGGSSALQLEIGTQSSISEQAIELQSELSKALEALGSFADRTRMSLYGETSECAVRLASAKMMYKRELVVQRVTAKNIASVRGWAMTEIENGKASLQRAEKRRRASAKVTEKKVNEARAKWEAVAGNTLQLLEKADDAKQLKIEAEKKAEQTLRRQLSEEKGAEIQQRITRRSKAEQAAIMDGKARSHFTGHDARDRAESEMTALLIKVEEETATQEKLIEKDLHSRIPL